MLSNRSSNLKLCKGDVVYIYVYRIPLLLVLCYYIRRRRRRRRSVKARWREEMRDCIVTPAGSNFHTTTDFAQNPKEVEVGKSRNCNCERELL